MGGWASPQNLHFRTALKPINVTTSINSRVTDRKVKTTFGIDERASLTFFLKGHLADRRLVKTGHISSLGNWHITSPLLCNKWTSLSLSLLLNADQDQELSHSCKKTLQNWTLQPLCRATVYWPTFYDYVLESSISFYEVCSAFSRFVILTRMTWFPSFDINAIPGFNNEMRATCTNAFSMMRM